MGFPKAVHVEVPLLIMLKIPRCSVAANSPQHAFSLTVLASGGPSPFGRKSHLLKFESGGDLDAIEPQLVKEIVIALVPEIIVKCPVSYLGIDVTSNLAAHCGVTLPGYIGADPKPTDVGFSSEIEGLAQIIAAS